MKLLHVICSLNPAGGGPPEAVRQLAYAYEKIGVDAEVLCQDSPGAPFLSALSFPVHALGERRIGGFGYSPLLRRWLRQNAARFDGLIMHGLWSYPGMAIRTAAARAGIPYVVFAHGTLSPWFKQYRLKHMKKTMFWPLQYPVLRDARSVLFTSAIERDQATSSFRPNHWRATCIPYGISQPDGDPAAQIDTFFEKIPSLRGRRFLLCLSRLHPVKGCDLLIGAFARVAHLDPDLCLVMAGPDQIGWKAELQNQCTQAGIGDRVHWPGMLTGDVKWGALRATDAFVLPSHTENFGVGIVEALAAGRPVLISDKVNISSDIQADGVGLVEEDTAAGTERLLQRWIAMPREQREAMADRAHTSFVNRYSMERAAAAIRALFTDSEQGKVDESTS